MTAALVIAAFVAGGTLGILAAAMCTAAARADVHEGHTCPDCRSGLRTLRLTRPSPAGLHPCTHHWHTTDTPTPPEPWKATR